MIWHSSKKELQEWVEQKERESVEKEKKNPCLSTKSWLQIYIFEDQYDIFFGSFHIELFEWISKLDEHKNYFKGDEPKKWNPDLIQWLKRIDNNISMAEDFWINNIL